MARIVALSTPEAQARFERLPPALRALFAAASTDFSLRLRAFRTGPIAGSAAAVYSPGPQYLQILMRNRRR